MRPTTIKRAIFQSCVGAVLSLALAAQAAAKTPPEVISLYKSYKAAEAEQDLKNATSYAKQAWEKSEELSGDTKLTGDLAFNYASVPTTKAERDQLDAIERSMELANFYEEDAPLVYLERGVKKLNILRSLNKQGSALKAAKELIDYADGAGLQNSTLLGEALTIEAGLRADKGQFKMATKSASRAKTIFDTATDGIATALSIHANLYRGYAYEIEEDHMNAAMSYQEVMEMTDGLDPEVYPIVGTALGRWIHMRGALFTQGKLDDAEQNGLCKCWPYDKERNEDVKPISRVPPKMPREAAQSGFVVVEFDLTDDGKTTNERVITAWPDYFEEPALKAMEKWEYAARTEEQTDFDRTDLLTTIRFRLSDEHGRLIW